MLKVKIDTNIFNSLDENIKKEYNKDGDSFILDVDEKEYKDNIGEFRTNNIELKRSNEKLRGTLVKFDGLDPEKYEKYETHYTKTKDTKLFDEGKIEELVNQRTDTMKRDYQAKVDKLSSLLDDERIITGTTKKQLSKVLIDSNIQIEAGKVGTVRKNAMSDILSRASRTWSVIDGEPVAMNGDSPIIGKDGKTPITMGEWCLGLIEDAPHLFDGSGGSGGTGNDDKHSGKRYIAANDLRTKSHNIAEIANRKVIVKR